MGARTIFQIQDLRRLLKDRILVMDVHSSDALKILSRGSCLQLSQVLTSYATRGTIAFSVHWVSLWATQYSTGPLGLDHSRKEQLPVETAEQRWVRLFGRHPLLSTLSYNVRVSGVVQHQRT